MSLGYRTSEGVKLGYKRFPEKGKVYNLILIFFKTII